MTHWEYKMLVYSIEGRFVYSLRFWADAAGKVYGTKDRGRIIGGWFQQMRQLEAALKVLDQEGWELVSVSIFMAVFTRAGCAILRRAVASSAQS